ncbi:hypothetical protein E5K00_02035 [Hymenobacter aquaticus]|uniref:Uncharacterized protein n=1 Tax=Hymenobacter aquaticus TaxID=1867101 RepID=A0A4Z0Q204_9BACT|nr:hypothetical protein [Hymenobacter aquaticus]TGE24017.1 hypothetical protein E5K00_02035 [Hymenobacter aquaticus]
MAKDTNALTQGLSGKVSGLVFRRNANGTVTVGNAPRPSSKAPTEEALAQRQRFQQAAFYGRAIQQDPALKAAYETGKDTNTNSSYLVAVADYLSAPAIRHVDFSAYRGQPGDVILVQATDNFAVADVRVLIQNPDGSLVEEGPAQPEPDGFTFRFTATVANVSLEGDKITVTVADRPGNRTTEAQTL